MQPKNDLGAAENKKRSWSPTRRSALDVVVIVYDVARVVCRLLVAAKMRSAPFSTVEQCSVVLSSIRGCQRFPTLILSGVFDKVRRVAFCCKYSTLGCSYLRNEGAHVTQL